MNVKWLIFWDYEREIVYFKLCELNCTLVFVRCERAQDCLQWPSLHHKNTKGLL